MDLETARKFAALEKQIADLQSWRRERDATDDRRGDQLEHQVKGLLGGAQKAVETSARSAMASVSDKLERLDQIWALTREQTTMLEEARTERLVRSARDSAAAELASRADLARQVRDAQRAHWIAVAKVALPIVATLAGLIWTAIRSHW